MACSAPPAVCLSFHFGWLPHQKWPRDHPAHSPSPYLGCMMVRVQVQTILAHVKRSRVVPAVGTATYFEEAASEALAATAVKIVGGMDR